MWQRHTTPVDWEAVIRFGLVSGGILLGAKLLGDILEAISDTPEQHSIRRSARAHAATRVEVCADHIGWGCIPPILNGRRPDVLVRRGGHFYIEEHETEESARRKHSIEQHSDLQSFADRHSNVHYRRIIVPN